MLAEQAVLAAIPEVAANANGQRIHELKTWPDSFELVWRGEKPYELRKNDRGFKVGDAVRLREWDPGDEVYSGRELLMPITCITPGGRFELPDHLCILGLGEVWTRTQSRGTA